MEEQETVEVAAETMAGDLLSALVQEIRLMDDPWAKLSQAAQEEIIERLRNRVTSNVRAAVHMLAAEGRVTVAADLESITSKDGIKVTLKVGKHSAGKHDLIDAVGQTVLVVIKNAEEHMGGIGDVKGDADQRELDVGSAADEVIRRAAGGAG